MYRALKHGSENTLQRCPFISLPCTDSSLLWSALRDDCKLKYSTWYQHWGQFCSIASTSISNKLSDIDIRPLFIHAQDKTYNTQAHAHGYPDITRVPCLRWGAQCTHVQSTKANHILIHRDDIWIASGTFTSQSSPSTRASMRTLKIHTLMTSTPKWASHAQLI